MERDGQLSPGDPLAEAVLTFVRDVRTGQHELGPSGQNALRHLEFLALATAPADADER
jgi:hypothetical protein